MSVNIKQNKDDKKIVINQIIVKPVNRQILDVGKWSDALKSADRGRRKELFDLYENILTDGVLGDAIDKRIRAVTGADLTFQLEDGTEVPEIITFIDTDEFEYLLEEIVKAVFWEFSLIEPTFDENGMHVYSVPRKHIRPDTKTIAINETDPEGQIDYAKLDVLEVISRKQKHGLLLRACPYAILKRGGIGDWAQMVEIFGMPQRIGKYSVHDPEARKALEQAFNSQGGAATLIVPKETDVETTANSGTGGGNLYKDFIATLDEQLLITILSQTMTTKDGSSRSQSETHKEVEEEVNKQDLRFVQRILNHKFLPILERRGYPVKGGSFVFPKVLENLTVQEIISLSGVLAIPAYYVQERYGIPAAEKDDVILQRQQTKEPEEPQPAKGKKPKAKNRLRDFFAFASTKERGDNRNFATKLTDSITGKLTLSDKYSIDLKELLQEALNEVYDNEKNGKEQPIVSRPLFDISNNALQQGINSVFSEPEFGKKNEAFIEEFCHNTAVFAAFKNHRQTADIVALLYDKNGNLRPFSKFKKLALQVSRDYNVNWLQTEYNTAVRAARQAVNYRKWLETEHLYPNLEYLESTASHPRTSHLDYVGTILPIRHKWWDTHMPPSDWNCACPVRPTDKDVTPVPGAELVPPVFRNNPGKTAEFVKISATAYYKSAKEESRNLINKIAIELQEEVTEKRFKSGGLIQTPIGFKQNKDEESKNITAYTHLAKKYGAKYKLLSVVDKDGVKNPDALNLINNQFSDAKTPKTLNGKSAIQNSIKSASGQRVQEAYIYLENDYSMQEIWSGLKASLQGNRAATIKEIIISFEDGRIKRYDVDKIRAIFNKKRKIE